jgi:hypothetical protein
MFGPYMVTMLFVGLVLITLDRLLRLLFFCWWYADIPGPNFGPSILTLSYVSLLSCYMKPPSYPW